MTIHDATEEAYKNGYDAGIKHRQDLEGWYVMELTEAIDRLKEENAILQKLTEKDFAELRGEVKRLAVMLETYITEQRFREKQGRAHP